MWVRVLIVKNLEEASRLPVRVEEQQAQQLAMNPPRSAGDCRHEIQLTAMVPVELPVLGILACRLLAKVLVRVARVKQFSVPVRVPRRSTHPVMPKADVDRSLAPIIIIIPVPTPKARTQVDLLLCAVVLHAAGLCAHTLPANTLRVKPRESPSQAALGSQDLSRT